MTEQHKNFIDTNPLATWDITIPEGSLNEFIIIDNLQKIAKKWAFQLELSENTNYKHWQLRMSLFSKKRLSNLIPIIQEIWPKCNASPTSAINQKNQFYVTKEQTRIKGPWTDKDISTLKIPKYIKRPDQLWGWQKRMREEILKQVNEENDRSLNLLIDPTGTNGKSALTECMIFYDKAVELIPVGDAKDILRAAYDSKDSKIYITDFPRALPKDNMKGYWAGLETIKKGHLQDDRYELRERWLEVRPQIFVTTNAEPNPEFMSSDRWKIWRLEGSGKDAKLYLSDFIKYSLNKQNINITLPKNKPEMKNAETQTEREKEIIFQEKIINKPDIIISEFKKENFTPIGPIEINFGPRRYRKR